MVLPTSLVAALPFGRCLCLLATIAAAACAGKQTPHLHTGDDGKGVVHAISIDGNKNVSANKLVKGLALDDALFDPVVLELDKQRIEAVYRSQGYFSARVVKTQVTPVGTSVRVPGVVVRFFVTEGKPTLITDVTVLGAPNVDDAGQQALRDLVDLKVGDIFVHKQYTTGKARIATRLVEQGFAFARVMGEARVAREKNRAAITITVDTGPLVHFGTVLIEGLDRIPESSVRARIAWRKGQRFHPRKLAETRKLLYGLGRFRTIDFEFGDKTRPAVANITIRVTEANGRHVRMGFGIGTDPASYELRLRAGLVFPGLVDPLLTARFEVRPAYRFFPDAEDKTGWGVEGTAGIERPDFLLPRLLLTSQLSYQREDRQIYTAQGVRLRTALARAFFSDRFFLSAGWEIHVLELFDPDSAISDEDLARLHIETPYQLAFFDQRVGYDGRDNPLQPHRGVYVALRFEEAGPFALGAFEYVRAIPEARVYVPVWRRLTLAAKARLGFVLSGQGSVPLTQRFFGGGASSQRGFSLARLSPFISDATSNRTVAVGGEALFESSLEARVEAFHFWGNWHSLVFFLDGADVRDELSEIDLGNLHWAAGGGLRLRTSVGAIRGDIGFRLNRTGPGEPDAGAGLAWHISLGESF